MKNKNLTITFYKVPFKSKVRWFKNMFFLRLILFIRKITKKSYTKLELFIVKHFLYNGEQYISLTKPTSIFHNEYTDYGGDYVNRALLKLEYYSTNKEEIKAFKKWKEKNTLILTEKMSEEYFKRLREHNINLKDVTIERGEDRKE